MKLYHELAEYYFSIENNHREISEDITLIRSLVEPKKNPLLLDIGCGTGEHISLLHKAGFECTGIDVSEDMLRIARKRFPGSGSFIHQDMLSFDYYETFDIIICLFGSFNYILNDSDVDKVFWNTWRALKPGGSGLFEIWNSFPIEKIQGKKMSLVSVTHHNNIRIDRRRGFDLLEKDGTSLVDVAYTYTIRNKEGTRLIKDKHTMRVFSKNEIKKFAVNNGFVMKNVYSNYRGDTFNKTSNKMVVHFIKK